ncbi:hypothetical protein H8959_015843 [Pygathrix nigripes]
MQGKKPGGSSGGGRSGELQGDEAQRNKKKKKKVSCFSNIKIFLVSECALMLAQGTVGAYLVSVLTTLERRFNLQSADVGVIASSFEIGNLALILFVSYFGARGHRPRLIGCGGIVMALGALLSALPEFLTHQYKYEAGEIRWGAEGRDVCAANGSGGDEGPDPDLICRNRTATNMMYLLLIGAQVLLGIGATPVQPLGVSYIDDHVRRKDSSLYIEALKLRDLEAKRNVPSPPFSLPIKNKQKCFKNNLLVGFVQEPVTPNDSSSCPALEQFRSPVSLGLGSGHDLGITAFLSPDQLLLDSNDLVPSLCLFRAAIW